MIKDPIYLDNNATTMVAPEVVEAMLPFFTEYYGNASSMHVFGGQVGAHIKSARQQVADFLNAELDEIIFTSCGTESDNTAITSALLSTGKDTLVTTRVEHSAIIKTAARLESIGKNVIWVDVDEKGQIDLVKFEEMIKANAHRIAIVSIMYANNETGTIFPIDKIAKIVKENGLLIAVDAVQVMGKIKVDLKSLPIDFLAMSGHKLHAPKGIGVLYVRRGTRFRPFMIGGQQEDGRRAGTENVPYIIGLGKACELAQKSLDNDIPKITALRDKLEKGLVDAIPLIKVNGDISSRLPNTLNISIKNVEGEALLLMLNSFNICASSGSACTSGSLEPSHVLKAMNVPLDYAHGSLRFSLSHYNTEAEIDKVIEVLPKIVENLRKMSPFKD